MFPSSVENNVDHENLGVDKVIEELSRLITAFRWKLLIEIEDLLWWWLE